MKRNMFGEPQPATFDEIDQAMAEKGLDAETSNAVIEDCTGEEPPHKGYTAEIRDNDTGDMSVVTLGFPDKAELIAGLRSLGITDITEF